MPSGLAKLEQLHMWSPTMSSQQLYTTAPHTADDEKLGWAWKQVHGMYEQSCQGSQFYSSYMWSQVVSVVSSTLSNSHYPYTCKNVVRAHQVVETRHDADTCRWIP